MNLKIRDCLLFEDDDAKSIAQITDIDDNGKIHLYFYSVSEDSIFQIDKQLSVEEIGDYKIIPNHLFHQIVHNIRATKIAIRQILSDSILPFRSEVRVGDIILNIDSDTKIFYLSKIIDANHVETIEINKNWYASPMEYEEKIEADYFVRPEAYDKIHKLCRILQNSLLSLKI